MKVTRYDFLRIFTGINFLITVFLGIIFFLIPFPLNTLSISRVMLVMVISITSYYYIYNFKKKGVYLYIIFFLTEFISDIFYLINNNADFWSFIIRTLISAAYLFVIYLNRKNFR